MPATNEQVQQYVNSRVRPRCEQFRALYNSCKDDIASIADVYANLNDNPDWVDARTDGPAHLLTPNDVLAWNAFINAFTALIEGPSASEWPIVIQGCVRPVNATVGF